MNTCRPCLRAPVVIRFDSIFPLPRHSGYNLGMAVALAIFGVAFAAFCVWLAVRIINRRERWAKWTFAASVVGLPVLYIASFGPACRIAAGPYADKSNRSISTLTLSQSRLCSAYWPIGWLAKPEKKASYSKQVLFWYAHNWLPDNSVLVIPASSDGSDIWLMGKE